MSRPQGAQSLAPLPVMDTAREIFMAFKANIGHLPRVALVPFSITFILITLEALVRPEAIGTIIFAVAQVLPMILFAVSWYRLVLLGPAQVAQDPPIAWSRREARVLYNLFLIAMIGVTYAAVMLQFGSPQQSPSMLFSLGWMLASLFLLAVLMGLCFALPAASVDEDYSLRQAWHDTRQCLAALLGLMVVVVVPAQIAALLCITLVFQVQQKAGLLVPGIAFGAVASYLVYSLWFTLLAVAFRRRTGWQPAGS